MASLLLGCDTLCDYQMTQNLIGNPVEADAVIDLIKQKPSTVYQHVVNIAKETLCLLDFLFPCGHQSQVLADRQMNDIHAAALSHNECISSSDVEEPKRFYFFILSTRFTDHYHTCRAGTIVFLAYIHGAKVHVFRLRHPNHPIILRNSLIIIVRYMMAQKSDEVRKGMDKCRYRQIFRS
ncbi:MAG: hypothetical protein L6V80_02115 [Bacteroidales bacterium]|nr:MAG: hypothetical protein L6V80_02115 [Bacteroidales bacterium]